MTAGEWVGFGDEMRLGLMGQVRRVWGATGIRVVQKVQLVREWKYLEFVVNPQIGQIAWTWVDNMSKQSIASGVEVWKQAGVEAVVWDRAGGHRTRQVAEVGLKLIEQPGYAPELNPAERVFEEIRREVEGWLYETLADKVAAVERVLRQLGGDPERVKRLVGWTWIQQALAVLPENTAHP